VNGSLNLDKDSHQERNEGMREGRWSNPANTDTDTSCDWDCDALRQRVRI
jgi:hypothetical protein